MLLFFYIALQSQFRIRHETLSSTFIIPLEEPTHFPYLLGVDRGTFEVSKLDSFCLCGEIQTSVWLKRKEWLKNVVENRELTSYENVFLWFKCLVCLYFSPITKMWFFGSSLPDYAMSNGHRAFQRTSHCLTCKTWHKVPKCSNEQKHKEPSDEWLHSWYD